MQRIEPDYYAALGLDLRCSIEQIRAAYRMLAKQHHPDVNPRLPDALFQTQQLNRAYEVLSDPERRRAYDQFRQNTKARNPSARSTRAELNVSQDVHLRIEEFLRGTMLTVRVNDPANPGGPESYDVVVPPMTAPGSRFRVMREGHFEGGVVLVRVRARADFRFKVSGPNLRCDLRISSQRAVRGGTEMVQGPSGRLRVDIPPGVVRGEIIRIPGEGLPKGRGGRGDLLVRITYRPDVRITRASRG